MGSYYMPKTTHRFQVYVKHKKPVELYIIHLQLKNEVLNNAVFLYSSKQPFILECAKIFGIDSAHVSYTGSVLKIVMYSWDRDSAVSC